MIFIVAIDPDSVQTLIDKGELGEEILLGIFEALLQNCMLAETSTWRVGPELREKIRKIKDPDIGKKVWSVLEVFADPAKSRLVDVIDDYSGNYETSLSEIICAQENNKDLDVAICEKPVKNRTFEFISALRFNSSNFARVRSRSASALIYSPREERADKILKEAFGRLVRHASIIEIYDRVMGKEFGPNYYEAIPHWCAIFKENDRDLELIIHTTVAQAKSVKMRFQDILKDSKVRVKVLGHPYEKQPHDRFFRACQFTLDIGRGIDLFDKEGWCRDVKIGLSNHGKFSEKWRSLDQ
jgi:hypothetical protein